MNSNGQLNSLKEDVFKPVWKEHKHGLVTTFVLLVISFIIVEILIPILR